MKKMMFLAAAAVVALSSCVKSESVDLGGKQAIAFEAFNEVNGRGIVEGTGYPTDGEFKVFAIHSTGSAAYFEPTTFGDGDSDGEWSGTPARYWPTFGTLDFAAYHPASLAGSATYGTGVINNVVVTLADNNKADQDDVMFSNLVDDADCTSHATQPIVFNHALAQIEVHVVTSEAGLFEVTNLTLNNTIQDGTLTITPAVASTAEWTVKGDADNTMTLVSTATTVPTSANEIASVLVVPGAQTSLDLQYTIGGTPMTHPTIDLSANGNWVMGKKYIYTISFGAHEIKFTPSVVDWTAPASSMPDTNI